MAARRLRLGMVGGGRDAFIGAVHRMAARQDGHYDIAAGALGRDPARAVEDGIALGFATDRSYPDYATMAAREAAREDRIDAVAIVTPNDAHYAIARVFLDAGIHVICEKPMTTSLADAVALCEHVERSGRLFVLTHNYSGYPLVREARERVRGGALGAIRVVQVEYPQDWLATRLEDTGQKQASWRADPSRAGVAGSLGDLGTHAHHLLRFVTGLEVEAVSADLARLVPGRQLDDNAHVMMRFANGARGMLWTSQVSPGNENALRLRVYGERGGIEWSQEQPNQLRVAMLGEAPQVVARGFGFLGASAQRATRLPPGHPEGYLEAFAQIYTDAAELIRARDEAREPDPLARLVPDASDGVAGLAFIEACAASSARDSRWVTIPGRDR